jgi:hypothetical protein
LGHGTALAVANGLGVLASEPCRGPVSILVLSKIPEFSNLALPN